MKNFFPSLLPSCLSLALLLVSSCGITYISPDVPPAPPAPTVTVKLGTSPTNPALGSFLTDGQGNTLYYFANDVAGTPVCTGGCANLWPAFNAGTITVGTGLTASDFTTGTGPNGQPQTFFRGWPLYYYAPNVNGQNTREAPGETRGEGIGGGWFVARLDYTVVVARAPIRNAATGQTTTRLYLTDPQGRTLYTFARDARLPASQATNCTGGCSGVWPVFSQQLVVAPSTLRASDFGSITRTDGPGGSTRTQATYKGQPLYYYAQDANRGQVNGDGVATGTDLWAVAEP